jgi:hypothetical protein
LFQTDAYARAILATHPNTTADADEAEERLAGADGAAEHTDPRGSAFPLVWPLVANLAQATIAKLEYRQATV